MCWITDQLCSNDTKIIWSWQQRVVHAGLGNLLQASWCRIAAVMMNPKYSPVSEVREDMARLQEQDVYSGDIGSIGIKLTQGHNVMGGTCKSSCEQVSLADCSGRGDCRGRAGANGGVRLAPWSKTPRPYMYIGYELTRGYHGSLH